MDKDNTKDIKLMRMVSEDLATVKLLSEGYTIIERNYKSNCGEISIVCKKNNTIYFVITGISNTVWDGEKQSIIDVAENYIMTHGLDQRISYKFKEIDVTIKVLDKDV